jgi:hypothetical protein
LLSGPHVRYGERIKNYINEGLLTKEENLGNICTIV